MHTLHPKLLCYDLLIITGTRLCRSVRSSRRRRVAHYAFQTIDKCKLALMYVRVQQPQLDGIVVDSLYGVPGQITVGHFAFLTFSCSSSEYDLPEMGVVSTRLV